MRRPLLAMVAIAALALPTVDALGARLCRDSKGLFTPCVGEPAPRPRRLRPEAKTDGSTAAANDAARPGTRAKPRRAAPPLVGRTRLCRDSKGLFTPCA